MFRQLIIASIPSLKVLNGTELTKTERYGAELDYLKKYGLEYLKAKKDGELERFFLRHPTYPKFVKTFGEPDEDELTTAAKMAKATLTTNLVEVSLKCPPNPDFKHSTKKLPPNLTVLKLRALLQRLVRPVKAHQLELSYTSREHPEVEVPMDNDMRDLAFYGLASGDTLILKWQ